MTPDLLRELVALARFSPSVHNVQPTRWRLAEDGAVMVLDAPDRRLPAGDPTGRDALASHGAAVEGFAIAASQRGLATSVSAAPDAVARLDFEEGAAPDPLAPFLTARRTFRGRFLPGQGEEALEALSREAPELRLVTARDAVAEVAALNDAASLRAFRDRAFRLELLSWMRLSRRHPDWSRDGLNAEAMQMSAIQARGAGLVLRPGPFELLDRLGLAGAMTAEAAVVRSSLALAVLAAPDEEPPFETGRRWHRLWLSITKAGLAAAPMTILGDDREAASAVGRLAQVPPGQRVVTVMRMGVAPPGGLAEPARLPADELIV